VVRAGCWAHARRKFKDAIEERPKAASVVLRLISRLYKIEREWDETTSLTTAWRYAGSTFLGRYGGCGI
jgi:hypothetical protein